MTEFFHELFLIMIIIGLGFTLWLQMENRESLEALHRRIDKIEWNTKPDVRAELNRIFNNDKGDNHGI
jgi:hypothetical protein